MKRPLINLSCARCGRTLIGVVAVLLLLSFHHAYALPSSGGEADASAKWETLSVPNLLVTDPFLAQQVAVIPVTASDDHAVASGTAVVAETLGGPIVRGFTEVGFASPNTHGGGSLEATSFARVVTIYQTIGTGSIDLDVDVHIDGSLEGGNFFSGAAGNLTSEAAFSAILHTSSNSTTLFTGDALFDIRASGGSVLTVSGDWTSADFSTFSPGGFFNQGRRVNLNDANENAAILNPGDQFAIELILDTSVYAVGAFEAAARANFDSTGGFILSSDAAGASFVQIIVPEPVALTMIAIAALAVSVTRSSRPCAQ